MIVYGRNTVLEGLKSDYRIKEIFLEDHINTDSKISEIKALASDKNIPIKYISHKELGKLTKSQEHQGVGCNIEYKEAELRDIDLNQEKGYIYISESTFEQNIAAIIRTAECAGFGGVLIPNKINITPTIAKISTGAVFHLPVIRYPIFQAIKEFKKNGFFVYGIERGGNYYFNETINSKSLFIIGGEDKSLSDPVRKDCDAILEIPQFGKINSLNMSNASSILIYEYVRQNFKSE